MKAIIASTPTGPATLTTTRPKPSLRPTYLLIRTQAVAANPADHAYLSYGLAGAGSLLGCDYAGIIEAVGEDVSRDWKVGERVCGCTRAGDPEQLENGTAAEWIVVKADLQVRIPEHVGWADAAGTGVVWLTVGRCLYKAFNVAFPSSESKKEDRGPVIIYGGSSAMGTACIQFAKLSGFTVITTCSPHNFELVKSYGADHVLDHHDPAAPHQVRALLGGQELKYTIDCISKPGYTDGTAFCGPLLAPGGTYSALAPMVSCGRADVTDVPTVGFSFLGEEWSFMGHTYPASKEDFEFSRSFAVVVEKLWAEGKIRPHPVEVREGGLEVFPQMMGDLEEGRVSGKKLVVEV